MAPQGMYPRGLIYTRRDTSFAADFLALASHFYTLDGVAGSVSKSLRLRAESEQSQFELAPDNNELVNINSTNLAFVKEYQS